MIYCPKCGAVNREKASYCDVCGAKMVYDGSAASQKELNRPVKPVKPILNGTNIMYGLAILGGLLIGAIMLNVLI